MNNRILDLLRSQFNAWRHAQQRGLQNHIKLMAAIDNLTLSITGLTSAVDAAVAKITSLPPPAGVPEEQVQAAADQVSVQTTRLNAALTPPPAP